MIHLNSSIEEAGRPATEALEQVAAHPWMERLARFGYATKGAVYMVIGVMATLAAIGMGGETTDTRGALRKIEEQHFGKFALGTVAFGLIGYVIWRWLQAIVDTEGKGTRLKGISIRIGYAMSGLVYAGLAFSAAKILIDVGDTDTSSSEKAQDWTARLMSVPYGPWLVWLAGACVIGFGLYQIYKGIKAKFLKRLKLGQMNMAKKTWAKLSGRVGYIARGIVFCILGVFLVQAARHYNPQEAQGLDGALDALARQAHGRWILAAVAAGLFIYGLYMLVEARYRVIAGS